MISPNASPLDACPAIFRCCVCSGCLGSEDLFSFGGGFACEGCVRDYYKSYPESEIQLELRERRAEALHRLAPKRTRKASFSTNQERWCGQCGHVAGTNPHCEECSL